jgi:sugar O-acyltransferase (sialic acid O-acetyltransferase NeuD family)
MKTLLAIVGAGGHTRSLLNTIDADRYEIDGIYDESYVPEGNECIRKHPLKGRLSAIPVHARVVLAIGNNAIRVQLYELLRTLLLQDNLIHCRAVFEDDVRIGTCNQIFSGAYINSGATIGRNNIINTNSIIEHESIIGDHCHVSVNSILCGRARIGNHCFIGAAAVVIDKVSICDNVTIGANSVVVEPIEQPGVYVGNPVRKIR